MKTRRDFLKLAGLSTASGLAGCAADSSSGSWSSQDQDYLKTAIVRNGTLGWAAWQEGRMVVSSNPNTRGTAYSITKSLAALAATKAADDGWLSPSELVADTISEWRGDSGKGKITVLMLLQQVSGLDAGGTALYSNHPRDKGKAAVSLSCVNTPGTVFRYGPGHWEALAELMRRKLVARNDTLQGFMTKSVMSPLRLNTGNWRSDKQDIPYFSTGTELSSSEFGRLGELISDLLSGKNSNGFTAEKFERMTRTSSVNPMFGGGLWRNINASKANAMEIDVEDHLNRPLPSSFWARACLSRKQPSDFNALIGSSGRRIYIWPSGGKMIARLGPSHSWSDTRFLSGL
ncbi:serine hydrolase [Luteolibacter sp. AS25]|uniref:serine hydrolase n=1 Tax=Luteolibacter sp. AS25 TaxID=3135776 RepID=UPI00398B64E4